MSQSTNPIQTPQRRQSDRISAQDARPSFKEIHTGRNILALKGGHGDAVKADANREFTASLERLPRDSEGEFKDMPFELLQKVELLLVVVVVVVVVVVGCWLLCAVSFFHSSLLSLFLLAAL
jgi:hypothetical protein